MTARKASYTLLASCVLAALFFAGIDVSAQENERNSQGKVKKQGYKAQKTGKLNENKVDKNENDILRRRLGPIGREQALHISRIVRINRLEELARAMGRNDLLQKTKVIRRNENARHAKAIKRVREHGVQEKAAKKKQDGKKQAMKKQAMKKQGMKKQGMKKQGIKEGGEKK